MRWLSLALCILFAVAPSAAQTNRVRRHLDPPGRSDCPPPWCEQVPTIHRLEAPADPSLYLGDVVSYERPSDWRHFAPMVDAISGLTNGLTDEMDKVVAIADWVKHSKVPAPHTYTSWPPSIIDIWGFSDGQCEEASFLLTAMLRLAGIPAMRFTTWNGEHTAVRAYPDGRWVVVDATPTSPDNTGPARIYAADDPSVVPAFQERPLTVLDNVAVPGTDTRVDTFTLFSNEPIEETAALSEIGLAYGRVAFPVTNQFLYYDPESRLFVREGQPGQRVLISYHIEAVDQSCLNERRSWYAQPLGWLVPGLRFRTIDHEQAPEVGTFYPEGYIETILPTCGTWRLVYSLSAENLDAPSGNLAYGEFTLAQPGDFAVIRADSLQPAGGADPYGFRTLLDALQELPTFEELGGVAPQ